MIRIKFNDSVASTEANFSIVSENSIKLTGKDIKANHSGFMAYRMNFALLGDYSDFTECRKVEGGYIFTKGIREDEE